MCKKNAEIDYFFSFSRSLFFHLIKKESTEKINYSILDHERILIIQEKRTTKKEQNDMNTKPENGTKRGLELKQPILYIRSLHDKGFNVQWKSSTIVSNYTHKLQHCIQFVHGVLLKTTLSSSCFEKNQNQTLMNSVALSRRVFHCCDKNVPYLQPNSNASKFKHAKRVNWRCIWKSSFMLFKCIEIFL